jgi:cytoplasmic iron level regulating protein YaaA (DUF328/UPF0246 family)
MLALVSPAKKLDYESECPVPGKGKPQLLEHTLDLTETLKELSQTQIQSLMSLSDKLGELNYKRYQRFSENFDDTNARPAAYAFRGDTYIGLDADTLSPEDMDFAQEHLGILSGLYGLLRPLDFMQAYRLEMGTKLHTARGEDLYDFWGDTITQAINKAIANHKNKSVICLASNEYIKAIQPKDLDGPFITCNFKEMKNGAPKVIGLFAKRARGMMARYIIQNRIEVPEGLKAFDVDGYQFVADMSDDANYTFLRDQG